MSDNDQTPEKPAPAGGDNEDFPTLKIRMVSPMPGLETHLDFNLSAVDETGVLWTLKSVINPNVRLFAVPPVAFFDGYNPMIPSSARLRIGLPEGVDPFILVIVHPATGSYPHTANLLAPLVINPENETMNALQVVLEDQDWPLQAPIGDPKS